MEKYLPEWDLSSLYASPEDPKVDQDLKELEGIDSFRSMYEGRLSSLSAQDFLSALKAYEKFETSMRKLYCYAYLIYSQEMNEDARVAFFQKIRECLNEKSEGLVFFSLELNHLSDAFLESAMQAEPALRIVGHQTSLESYQMEVFTGMYLCTLIFQQVFPGK